MKPGYKNTEIGVIPEEWEVKTLKEVAQIQTGIAKNANEAVVDPVSVHYLRVANVQDGFLDLSELSQITLSRKNVERYLVLPGDVLMNEGGDLDKLGRGAIWSGEIEQCVHQNHVFVVRSGPALESNYLNIWSGSAQARRYFLLNGKQTTNLASINKTSLGDLPVALPPLPEQRAIASALSDIDALLSSLDRLIAKKRDIKTAAMQALLSGKQRLPGFAGAWVERKLGEVGTMSKGKGIKRDDVKAEGIPCLRYGEIYTTHNDIIRKFQSFISREIADTSRRLKRGDIIFAGSGETAEEIGKCVAFIFDIEAYVGGDTIILSANNTSDTIFLAYLLNSAPIAAQKARMGQGDAVVHISARSLADVELKLPPLDEQRAIAQVLSDMDAEIEALEAQRDKTAQIKQGMMQELLTGKTRLV